RIEQPIMTTYTRRDGPLHDFFHLGVRRARDLGEQQIAGAPSRYAALGGYGPAGAPSSVETLMRRPEDGPYPELRSAGNAHVLALRANDLIKGHSDISNEATWWALYCQVAAGFPASQPAE